MIRLPDLPFKPEALEPAMSAATLRTHHDKHHAAYVKKVNALLDERSGDKPSHLEAIVRLGAKEKDQKLFNNAAQAWNHGFFWQCLTPEAQDRPRDGLGRLRRGLRRRRSSRRGRGGRHRGVGARRGACRLAHGSGGFSESRLGTVALAKTAHIYARFLPLRNENMFTVFLLGTP